MNETRRPFSRAEWLTAGATALVSLGMFAKTVQPSVPFWDCGEFIACSYTMGVTHPPGAPLFLLIGRLFTLLPFGPIPLMVNWISVLSSAAAAGVAALIAMLLVKRAFGERCGSAWARRSVLISGWAAGLLTAFSDSFWFNAVEAEVYGLTLLMMLGITLLMLLWYERRGTPFSYRVLAFVTFLGFLGIAVHMTVFLMMPAVALLVLISDGELRRDPRVWIAAIVLSTVMFSIDVFGVLTGILLLLSLGMVMLTGRATRPRWGFVAALVLAGALGYTTQLYIPIRSAENPTIDQNDPETWDCFKQFLERKQYSQESMFSLMFTRRGNFGNQIGTHARLGYWGFFMGQYTPKNPWWLHLIPTFLGFWALWWLVRRTPARGMFIGAVFLICSLGLVIYINMSDGMRGVTAEVRDRDYIFSPAYVAFAILVGIGFGRLIERLSRRVKLRAVAVLVAIVAVLSPVVPALANYHSHDRTDDYVAWDYAYNLLDACEENGVLFTNGDNDTFPLWYIQEVDSVRVDVRVVNLSLVNTDWYILQMKRGWGHPERAVNVNLTDEQIKWHDRPLPDGRVHPMPLVPYVDRRAGEPPVQRLLVPYQREDGSVVRVQDIMIREILVGNMWRDPVYLSVTVSADNKSDDLVGLPLSQHMLFEGMVERVVRDSVGPDSMNVDWMEEIMLRRNRYRGISDPDVHKDENSVRLIENYISGFLRLVSYHRDIGNFEHAHEIAVAATELYPPSWRAWYMRAMVATDAGKVDDMELSMRRAIAVDPGQMVFYDRWAMVLDSMGLSEERIRSFTDAFEADRGDWVSGVMAAHLVRRTSGPTAASPLLDAVVDANDDVPWVYLNRFVLSQELRSPTADLTDLERAYDMAESQPLTYMMLDALRIQGRNGEAASVARDWLHGKPDDMAVWNVYSQLTGTPVPRRQ
jgi:hypothetical protein